MRSERTSVRIRPMFGLVLLVGVLLAGGAILELAVRSSSPSGFLRAWIVVGLVVGVSYVVFVFLPQREQARVLEKMTREHALQCDSLRLAMEDLRLGDLVEMTAPARGLPDDMAVTVEAAASALSGLVQQIQTSSVEVATAARTVHETAAELATGSSQQAAAVVEITATTEELARTAGQIAVNAVGQAELASRSEVAADAGVAAVRSSASGAEIVRERIETIAERADTLGQRSQEIYRVLDLITEIAQETHILSLNAAIEASAAGEHGIRFSVVADEVRRLAERSRESVDSVRGLLDEFAGAIRAMILATEEGSKSAAQVMEQSRSTESSIESLRSALADTAQAAREISFATQEQQGASDQVVLTLKEVSEVIQRMADGLRQFTGTSERLNQLALSIQLLTQSFRLASTHSLKHEILGWAKGLADFRDNLEVVTGRLEDILQSSPYIELTYVADPTGVMMAFAVNSALVGDRNQSGSIVVGEDYADRPWFQAVARKGRTVVTPLYDSLLTGEQCFSIAAAIHGKDNDIVGVVGADINVPNWTRI